MRLIIFIVAFSFFSCANQSNESNTKSYLCELVILGNVQDAGSPQIGCKKVCCINLWNNPPTDRKVVSLGVIDRKNDKSFMFDASPDFITQFDYLNQISKKSTTDGIFLTHAHIGHYTGLMFLGRESMNANNVPVYAMPNMKFFLETNGPWSQLVKLKNIELKSMKTDSTISVSSELKVTPLLVPHRDEFSETVGFKIEGPNKSALFIPDIDKWGKWERSIIQEIKNVDLAFLDGTFFENKEIPNRDMSEIPHPFIVESMSLFSDLPIEEKAKIHFIHFNHTNPLLVKNSSAYEELISKGFNIAKHNQSFEL